MDPLTLAGSFATVVGLLANFKAERSGASLEEFMSWMREQHQESMVASISQHQQVQRALSTLLAVNHDELVARLSAITAQLAEVAQRVDGFGELASLLNSSSPLSAQGRSVLQQIASSGAKFVLRHKGYGGTKYMLMDGATGEVQATEPQFLEEDFDTLVGLGYLRREFTSQGNPRYTITRSGVATANAA